MSSIGGENTIRIMRLSDDQCHTIRQLAYQVAGKQARVHLFGSRLDDSAHGGDLDLMIEVTEAVENPALISAQLAALVSRTMHGRKVDVLVSAPNLLRLPIHDIAFEQGRVL